MPSFRTSRGRRCLRSIPSRIPLTVAARITVVPSGATAYSPPDSTSNGPFPGGPWDSTVRSGGSSWRSDNRICLRDEGGPMAERSYRRSLGLFSLVSLGLGGTVGSGIFVVPGIAAGLLGPAALFVWLLVGLSVGAVAFALASVSPVEGENLPLFLPVGLVFGSVTADTLMGAYHFLSSVFGCASICAGIGQYLDVLRRSDCLDSSGRDRSRPRLSRDQPHRRCALRGCRKPADRGQDRSPS